MSEAGTPLRDLPHPPPALAQRLSQGWRAQWRRLRRPAIESGYASLCGSHHGRNQDAVLAHAPLFAVADGVGGGSAGELASSQLLAWCRDIAPTIWRDAAALAQRLQAADAVLAERLRDLHTQGPSATTFAGAWLDAKGRGHIAHVGDARILLGQPGPPVPPGWQVRAITQDQTYAHLGEAPPPGGSPDDPARMVGVGVIGLPPVATIHLAEGQWLMLCSDGAHRFLPPTLIAALWAQAERRAAPLGAVAQQLAQAAQAAGSRDDISVLLVRRNPRWGLRRAAWWVLAGALALVALLVALLVVAALWRTPARSDGASASAEGGRSTSVPAGTAEGAPGAASVAGAAAHVASGASGATGADVPSILNPVAGPAAPATGPSSTASSPASLRPMPAAPTASAARTHRAAPPSGAR